MTTKIKTNKERMDIQFSRSSSKRIRGKDIRSSSRRIRGRDIRKYKESKRKNKVVRVVVKMKKSRY